MITIVGTLAALCTAVIFGIDVLAAIVMRPVYAEVDDRMLVQITGRAHRYGDLRLSVPGIGSVVAGAATVLVAFLTGSTTAGVLAASGLAALIVWLVLFTRISVPINRTLITASLAGDTPSNARALQDRWESIINVRAVLQGLALVAFCLAIGVGAR
ncbi:MAG TPA: DUF1772 domain-containing protein [Micromonosporaceae bacterium]